MEAKYKKKLKDILKGPTIPRERSNNAQWAVAIISLAILLLGSYFSKSNWFVYLVLSSGSCVLIIVVIEILYRLCLICEEWKHVASRYNRNYQELLSDAFSFSPSFGVFTALSLFALFCVNVTYGNLWETMCKAGCTAQICAFVGITLLSRIFKLDYGPLYESVNLSKLNGLDYGSAMAYSFFHGFLNIVLPHSGTEQKGIRELMSEFESIHNISFARYKLLVLIPLSLYCPTSVGDKSNIVEMRNSLPEIKITRAGVLARVYKNTVYTVTNPVNKKKQYVCVEYATPLKTLHEIVSNNNRHANHYKKHSRELALNFYTTLRDILNENPDCGDYCELIFFEDKNSDGTYIDVGDVIISHLDKMKREEKKKA